MLTYGGDKLRRYCDQARRGGQARQAEAPRSHVRLDVARVIAAGADIVTITSYNEWHEGTQIEPARLRVGPHPRRYRSYEGG